jgi:hypothetical protein
MEIAKNYAPIVLFCYKRLDTLIQTVEALQKNYLAAESDLIIFSDAAKNKLDILQVNAVREYIKNIEGFNSVEIHCAEANKGLATSIIDGVSLVLNDHEFVIVLEDDLETTPNFLHFMNFALQNYLNSDNIYSICAFSIYVKNKSDSDVFLNARATSWGWATWKNQWEQIDFQKERMLSIVNKNPTLLKKFAKTCGADAPKMLLNALNGKIDSWYIRWVFSNFLENRRAVFPYDSKVNNIGFNINATHCNGINSHISKLDTENKIDFKFAANEKDPFVDRSFLYSFSYPSKVIFRFKLLFKRNGLKLVINEINQKLNPAN